MNVGYERVDIRREVRKIEGRRNVRNDWFRVFILDKAKAYQKSGMTWKTAVKYAKADHYLFKN